MPCRSGFTCVFQSSAPVVASIPSRSGGLFVPTTSTLPSSAGLVRAKSPAMPVYAETECDQITAPVFASSFQTVPPKSPK